MTSVGELFADEPATWGGPGDPSVWRTLRERLGGLPVPAHRGAMAAMLRLAVAREIGVPLCSPFGESVVVDRSAHAGTSFGTVSLDWWRSTGLPVLLERAGFDSGAVRLRVTIEEDWAAVRALRLRNVTDNPVSYGATIETTLGMSEEDWRLRARRGTATDSTSVVALGATGRWLGMMSGQAPTGDDGVALLTGVYVEPDVRGRALGVADELIAEVVAWASLQAEHLRLWVDAGRGGAPARSFYRRHGFVPTGRQRALDGGFAGEQSEMVLALRNRTAPPA